MPPRNRRTKSGNFAVEQQQQQQPQPAEVTTAATKTPSSPPLPAFSRPEHSAAATAATSDNSQSNSQQQQQQEQEQEQAAASPEARNNSNNQKSNTSFVPSRSLPLKSPSVAPQLESHSSVQSPAAATAATAAVPAAPPLHIKKRFVSSGSNVGATVLDTFVQLPRTLAHLWRFLFFGVLSCLDKVLDLYLLPLRIMLLQKTTMRHTVLGVFALLGALSLGLIPFGEGPGHAFSYWYHLVQGISALKLYVMCNMLEVFERLVANVGGDVFEALWVEVGGGGDVVVTSVPLANATTTTSSSSSSAAAAESAATHSCTSDKTQPVTATTTGPPSFLRNLSLIVAGVLLTSLHAYVIMLQVVVYNVALNGDNYSLIALLASNNFGELRRMVTRKVTSDDLFRTACGDVIEQMQLVIFFVVMLLRHSMSLGFGTVEIGDLFLILLVEIVIDTLKHTFVIRNNGIKESIYSRYEAIWFWDVARDVFRSRYLADCEKALSNPARFFGIVSASQAQQHMHHHSGVASPSLSSSHHHHPGVRATQSSTTARAGPSSSLSLVLPLSTAQLSSVAQHHHHDSGGTSAAPSRDSSLQPAPREQTTNNDRKPAAAAGSTNASPQSGSLEMTPLALPPQLEEEQSGKDSAITTTNAASGQPQKQQRPPFRTSPYVTPKLTATTASSHNNSASATLPPRFQRPPPLISLEGGSVKAQPQQQSQQQSTTSTRSAVFTTVVEESLLLGYPARRVGLVTAPYVSVLWWITAPLLFSVPFRVLVWCMVAVSMAKLTIRAVNRGVAARWVCRARSWGPGRPAPSAIQSAATASTSSGNAVVGGTVDDLSRAEQQLLDKLDRVQQFRFV